MIEIKNDSQLINNFNYQKYCNCILDILPRDYHEHLTGIHLVDQYIESVGCDSDGLGCYYGEDGKGIVLVHIANLAKEKIPKYLYVRYPEIAALFLSEVIGHEFGHHVYAFGNINANDEEEFANQYTSACYFNYFKSRKIRIVLSYYFASLNIIRFHKEQRLLFRKSMKNLLHWYKRNSAIEYPA